MTFQGAGLIPVKGFDPTTPVFSAIRESTRPVVNTDQREGVTSGQTSLCSTKNVAEGRKKVEEKGGKNKKMKRAQTEGVGARPAKA